MAIFLIWSQDQLLYLLAQWGLSPNPFFKVLSLTLSYTAFEIPVWHGGSKVSEEIYAIKMIFLFIFWQIWLYNLDPMYIRGLHTDFEVHSIKNQKMAATFFAAIFWDKFEDDIATCFKNGRNSVNFGPIEVWFFANILFFIGESDS